VTQIGGKSWGEASRAKITVSTGFLSFSFAPAARAGRRKNPMRNRGTVMSHERIELCSEEPECGFQNHVCGRSFSWDSAVWLAAVALNTVGIGVGDDIVRDVAGMLVCTPEAKVGSTKYTITSKGIIMSNECIEIREE
jgi:hypothetical protein